MTNIEIQARKLVKNLLNDYLPNKQITIPVKGEFRGLYYPSGGGRLAVESEAIIEFLLENSVLILHEKLPSSNDYPVKPTRLIVSYNQQLAEEFVDNSADALKDVNRSNLTSMIPKGGKYKVVRRITKLFNDKSKVANWKISACITPTFTKGKKFSKKNYNQSLHYPRIKNRSVTIKKYWENAGYTIKVQRDFSEKIRI